MEKQTEINRAIASRDGMEKQTPESKSRLNPFYDVFLDDCGLKGSGCSLPPHPIPLKF